jgi:hypothetical protein
VAGKKLLNPKTYPLVVAKLAELDSIQDLERERSAREVQAYIHAVLFIEPTKWFDPGYDGGWLIDKEKYRELPKEVSRLIEEIRVEKVTKRNEVIVERYWIRLVSKADAMKLAAKYALIPPAERSEVTHVHVNWGDMYQKSEIIDPVDVAKRDEQNAREASKQQLLLPSPTTSAVGGPAVATPDQVGQSSAEHAHTPPSPE